MARFVFELQAVLSARRAQERAKQRAVAELEAQRLAAENEIRACRERLEAERDDLRDALAGERAAPGAVNLAHVRMQAAASLHVVADAQRAVLRLAGLMKRLDAARLDLLEATTRRKAVETLRERRLEAFMDEQRRRERAAADELAVMHAARAASESEIAA